MKRTISICLLLLCVLASSAQMQRKFLDFTLGESTKTQVYKFLKRHHYEFSEYSDKSGFLINDLKFAGYVWPFAIVKFHNNTFYGIAFYDNKLDEKMLYSRFDLLDSSLKHKYSDFLILDTKTKKQYTDGIVHASLQCEYRSTDFLLSLTYLYIPILRQQNEEQESDL